MDLKAFFKGMYQKTHFWKRMLYCFLAVCVMGFCVSWLNFIALGTDPFSAMNFGISGLLGMSFGNWQAIVNTILFVIVFTFGREQIGFGTVFNMFMVGYACDLTTFVRTKLFPDFVFISGAARYVMMLVLLAIFVVAAAVYMTVELGTSPYDAIPMIIFLKQKKLSYRVVRILYDCFFTLVGFLAGGGIGIVTVLMAFTIGPVVAYVGKIIQKYID